MKKLLSLILAAALMLSMAACAGTSGDSKEPSGDPTAQPTAKPAETETPDESDPILDGEKPELNFLTYYLPYNMHEQPSYAIVEEMTGYKVNWFNLPQENADEKLLLEIAGGTSYDMLVRLTPSQANQLQVQNALHDVRPLLEKYGSNILAAVSPIAMDAVTTEDGQLYGIPFEAFDGPQPGGDPYGILKGGIGF